MADKIKVLAKFNEEAIEVAINTIFGEEVKTSFEHAVNGICDALVKLKIKVKRVYFIFMITKQYLFITL